MSCKVPDLVGKRFGRLSVIGRAPNGGVHSRFRCKCDCGKEIAAYTANLLRGFSESCGCLRAELARKRVPDLTGRRFGKLLVLARSSTARAAWQCQCDCGRICEAFTGNLNYGKAKSCGCWNADPASKPRGELHPRWKGDHLANYRSILRAGHPNAGSNGRLNEHT